MSKIERACPICKRSFFSHEIGDVCARCRAGKAVTLRVVEYDPDYRNLLSERTLKSLEELEERTR
jgi:hypothetical protein